MYIRCSVRLPLCGFCVVEQAICCNKLLYVVFSDVKHYKNEHELNSKSTTVPAECEPLEPAWLRLKPLSCRIHAA